MNEQRKTEIVGHYGAMLSLIEVGLGSLLHGFHIPFAGIFLSLNQGYFLCRGVLSFKETREGGPWVPYHISNIAAVLKSLSPAGQKLGPMTSLSMQGLLFNLGPLIFGVTPSGLCLGMVLLSFWSFVQPLITYYIFFGEELFKAWEYTYLKTLPYHQLDARKLLGIFISVVVVKAVAAAALGLIAWKRNGHSSFQDRLVDIGLKRKDKFPDSKNPVILALRDLLRPIFLLSLLMTGVFLYFSQHEKAQIIWYLLRPVALGFIFFYFSRTLTLDKGLAKLEKGRFRTFSLGCQEALRKLRKVI